MGLPKDRKYSISFDTKEVTGAIKAVNVTLGTEIVRDMSHQFSVNLCDDPLYPTLVAYVRSNPPGGKRRG